MFLPSFGLISVSGRARPFAPAPLASTNIADVLAGKGASKGRAPACCIEFLRDLGIAQVSGEFVNPRDGLHRSFQGPLSSLDALHLKARHHA